MHTTHLEVGGEEFVVCVLTDISDQKRRLALEKIFFHDISNTAMAISGRAELLSSADPSSPDELSRAIARLSRHTARMVDEITALKQLAAAERGELTLSPRTFTAGAFLDDLLDLYRGIEAAQGKEIRCAATADYPPLTSDPVLLGHILGNMIKNALEACPPGGIVTIGRSRKNGSMEFWVHNPGEIPPDDQLQVFQRSFFTKGADRGLGTYSMKFLGEHGLGGAVSFASSSEDGTTFRLALPLVVPAPAS